MQIHEGTENQIDNVITKLEESNYLSEERMIESEIQKQVAKMHGKNRAFQELKKKGFLSSDISKVMDTMNINWFSLTCDLKEKKFGLEPVVDQKEKSKQIRYLQYRGHSMKDIMGVMSANNEYS